MRGVLRLVGVLRSGGIDWVDDNGETTLYRAATVGKEPVVEALVKAGAIMDTRDIRGLTLLYRAIYGDEVEATKFLLLYVAGPEVTNEEGNTALLLAIHIALNLLVQILSTCSLTRRRHKYCEQISGHTVASSCWPLL